MLICPLISGRQNIKRLTVNTRKIKIEDIKEYYDSVNDVRYRAVLKDSSNRPQYLRVIENGPIYLYLKNGYNYGLLGALIVSPSSLLINKGGDRAFTLKTTSVLKNGTREKRKDMLADLLKDKPEILDKYLTEEKFGGGQILNLIHLYNTGEPYKAIPRMKDKSGKKDDIY